MVDPLPAGVFMITKLTGKLAKLQNYSSFAPADGQIGDLKKISAEGKKAPILRDYQQEAIKIMLERKRCICCLSPGRGKTLTLMGMYLQLRFSGAWEVGDLFLVVTQANLIMEVFMKQAKQHGVAESCFPVLNSDEVPPRDACFIVVSFHMLELLKKKSFDEASGLLWQRRLHVVAIDEVHKLRGDGLWCNEVEHLCQRSLMSIGMTGSLFANDPAATAHVCKALCLHEEVCNPAFWTSEMSLQRSMREPYLAVFEILADLPDAKKPKASVQTYKARTNEDSIAGNMCMQSLAECLSANAPLLEKLHKVTGSRNEQVERKIKIFNATQLVAGPKVKAFFAAIERLFRDGFHKIYVTVMYLDVILLLEQFLLRDLRSTHPEVSVFSYSGWKTPEVNQQALKAYLDLDCSPQSKSILLMSISIGTVGLNIVNGDKSPMAHIEFDQPNLATDRFQAQCRVQREGNPYQVKLVVLEGEHTQSERILNRHINQGMKHRLAGHSETLNRIEEIAQTSGDDVSCLDAPVELPGKTSGQAVLTGAEASRPKRRRLSRSL